MSLEIEDITSADTRIVSAPVNMIKPSRLLTDTLRGMQTGSQLLLDKTKADGVLRGLVIARPMAEHYEIVWGVDFYLAAKEHNGLEKIQLNIMPMSDEDEIRNIVKWYKLTFDENPKQTIDFYESVINVLGWKKIYLAEVLGVSRSAISNRMALLNLDSAVWWLYAESKLKIQHLKHLSRIEDKSIQVSIAQKSAQKNWNTDRLYKELNPDWEPVLTKRIVKKKAIPKKLSDIKSLEEKLEQKLGTTVELNLNPKKNFSGELVVAFYGKEVAEGIVEKLITSFGEADDVVGTIILKLQDVDNVSDTISKILKNKSK